jgi:hypothetical protein
MPDFEPTRTPPEVKELLSAQRLLGKPIGIYRLGAPTNEIPDEIWRGEIPAPTERATSKLDDGTTIEACTVDVSWRELIARLTYGAFVHILDLHLSGPDSPYWRPLIVRDIGFFPADRRQRRFFHHLELAPHVSPGAWDQHSIWTRVHVDVRRDFANVPREPGGGISFPGAVASAVPIGSPTIGQQLPLLAEGIEALDNSLQLNPLASESVYQDLLERYPLLVDVYGEVRPRPRFKYPEGGGPTGKTYIEPDFIVVEHLISGPRYRLIEIERPGKQLATQAGHARVDLTQAAWQIGEWKTYIGRVSRNHELPYKHHYQYGDPSLRRSRRSAELDGDSPLPASRGRDPSLRRRTTSRPVCA